MIHAWACSNIRCASSEVPLSWCVRDSRPTARHCGTRTENRGHPASSPNGILPYTSHPPERGPARAAHHARHAPRATTPQGLRRALLRELRALLEDEAAPSTKEAAQPGWKTGRRGRQRLAIKVMLKKRWKRACRRFPREAGNCWSPLNS